MSEVKKGSGFLTGIQSIQWAVLMLANIIAIPIVVGAAFHMSPAEIATFMQRMLFVSGAATLVQLFIGHRMQVAEGPAGMWWALFMVLGAMSAPSEKGHLLQQLEMGLIISGIVLAVLGFLPIFGKVKNLFTPIVTGVYLILLVCQMSGPIFKSMLGITGTGHLNGKITVVCLIEALVIFLLSLKAKGIWRSMAL